MSNDRYMWVFDPVPDAFDTDYKTTYATLENCIAAVVRTGHMYGTRARYIVSNNSSQPLVQAVIIAGNVYRLANEQKEEAAQSPPPQYNMERALVLALSRDNAGQALRNLAGNSGIDISAFQSTHPTDLFGIARRLALYIQSQAAAAEFRMTDYNDDAARVSPHKPQPKRVVIRERPDHRLEISITTSADQEWVYSTLQGVYGDFAWTQGSACDPMRACPYNLFSVNPQFDVDEVIAFIRESLK